MEPIDKLVSPKNDEEKEDLVALAITSTCEADDSVVKFLAPNDTIDFKKHGVLIPVKAYSVLFPLEDRSCENRHCENVSVEWFCKNKSGDGIISICRETNFHYYCHYARANKTECRISPVPFEELEGKSQKRKAPYSRFLGALFVFLRNGNCYKAFVLDDADDIKQYLGVFGLSSVEISPVVKTNSQIQTIIADFLKEIKSELPEGAFPETKKMADAAREICKTLSRTQKNYNDKLLNWLSVEYEIFKAIEKDRYEDKIKEITQVSEFIFWANKILNRRKSRAGKSLEHHLKAIFDDNNIDCVEQMHTEDGHTPDFIFPNENAYRDKSFDDKGLVFLAAKTTCKDRWRQILDEADRFKGKVKYLFTLQPGISKKQMDQMKRNDVRLVVPGLYRKLYFKEYEKTDVLTLNEFITHVKKIQRKFPPPQE